MKRLRTKCPKCGGEIAAFDDVPGITYISGWTLDPTTGKVEPEWAGETEMIWDGQVPSDRERPYGCRDCGDMFALLELTFTDED